MSASISPTRDPARASATARLLATVDFPTPPLPLEIAMTCPRFGYVTGCCGGGTRGCAGRSSITGNARPAVLSVISTEPTGPVVHLRARGRERHRGFPE